MRLSSFCAIALAVLVVNSSGCKARGRQDSSARRPITHRLFSPPAGNSIEGNPRQQASEECDCYTCRMDREANQAYVIENVLQPANEPVASPDSQPRNVVLPPQHIAPVVEPINTDSITSPLIVPLEEPVDLPNNEVKLGPDKQDVPNEIIEDENLINQLPSARNETKQVTPLTGENDSLSDAEAEKPSLNSPDTWVHSAKKTSSPVIESAPIPTANVSVRLNNNSDSGFNSSRQRDANFEPQPTAPRRQGHSIWFAPIKKSDRTNDTGMDQSNDKQSIDDEILVAATNFDPETLSPAETDVSVRPVVLQARPVDHHVTYNGLPTDAPVREARLIDNATYDLGKRDSCTVKPYFHQLPPMEQRWSSPAPAKPIAKPLPSPLPTSQTTLDLPKPDHAEPNPHMTLSAAPNQQTAPATPLVRVIKPDAPILRLNAVTAGSEPEILPPIVSIQSQQETEVVGELQLPSEKQSAQDIPSNGLNQLHATPWKPMQFGRDEVRQVQSSIRRLTIRTQNSDTQAGETVNR